MLATKSLHTSACDRQIRRGADLPNGEEYWVAENGWFRLPGLFWPSEAASCGPEYLVRNAGQDDEGVALFAIYARVSGDSENGTQLSSMDC